MWRHLNIEAGAHCFSLVFFYFSSVAFVMGSGAAKYKQRSEGAEAALLPTRQQLEGASYRRRRTLQKQADLGGMGTGVVCSHAAPASQVRILAMPQDWRKKWERPAATFNVPNQVQSKSLPPLSAPVRLLPRVPPEQLASKSAVARMAVDYWRNEAAAPQRDVSARSPGSNAATSTTQSWTSGVSRTALSGCSSPAPA
eukprot:symbB.v1.2.036540.t1/scaffold5186.1/size29997/1